MDVSLDEFHAGQQVGSCVGFDSWFVREFVLSRVYLWSHVPSPPLNE